MVQPMTRRLAALLVACLVVWAIVLWLVIGWAASEDSTAWPIVTRVVMPEDLDRCGG
jgi:hypothetical protein